jgi:hypothetical protein
MAALSYYLFHGRLLASDGELPFLPAATPGGGEPDLVLRLGAPRMDAPAATPWYRRESGADVCPSIAIDRAEDGALVVRFADGTVFLVSGDGRSIALLAAPAEYTRGDVAVYALGPVAAVALHRQGAVLLHAAAVVMGGKAIVFAGSGGSGKSTTAAMLHRQGYDVLSDDLSEVVGGEPYRVRPSAAAIRLWPDSLDALYGAGAAFEDRAPSWEKKVVRVSDTDGAYEMGAILFLAAAQRGAAPRLERLEPRAGWLRLIADAYTVRLPDPEMATRIFDVTSALADRVPMYSFTPPPLEAPEGLGAFLERALSEPLP